jgi:hypothetical protein
MVTEAVPGEDCPADHYHEQQIHRGDVGGKLVVPMSSDDSKLES